MAKKIKPSNSNLNVVVTDNEITHILDELFEQGFTSKEVEVLPGKSNAIVRNLSASAQLDIEKQTSNLTGSTAYVVHTYSLALLSNTVIKYGDVKFQSADEANMHLKELPSIVLDKLVKAQNNFEHQIRKAIQIEETEKHFFETPSTPDELEPSPKE
jgi:hypothetical protein